jgi:hypothetical protein
MSRCKCHKPPHKSIESSTEEEEQRARRDESHRTAKAEKRKRRAKGIEEEDSGERGTKRWGTWNQRRGQRGESVEEMGNFRKIGSFPKCSHENKMIVYSSSPNLSDVRFCAKIKFKFFFTNDFLY